MLYMVNRYMDEYLETDNLISKAKAEKYAKIISKTVMNTGGFDSANAGQNAYFYDSAEGLITAVILVISEFCSPVMLKGKSVDFEKKDVITEKEELQDQRHIISVFKMIQDLLAPSKIKGKSQFQLLMQRLPEEHKARWLSGAALNTSEQAMASVLSTALSRLNTFLDSEIEQLLCFETKLNIESFCKEKSTIFLIMPEEDDSKYFLISLIVQQLYREMLTLAGEMGGKLPNRVMMFLDEFGTIPPIQSAEMMFSASRSRQISFVPIIQSLAQLEKNYGREGSQIIVDNCQISIYGGFAPNSETANVLSKNLGERTVMTGSVSQGRDKSKSLQMTGRQLMSSDELKVMKRDTFIVTRTGVPPMKTVLRLFFKWGISLDDEYEMPEARVRQVSYASKHDIELMILKKYPPKKRTPVKAMRKQKPEKSEDKDDEVDLSKIGKNIRC